MRITRIAALCLFMAGGFAAQAGTPLSYAAIDGDLYVVKGRVEAGEAVNEKDKWGWTPLLWAVYNGHLPVVQFLLEHEADPNCATTLQYNAIRKGSTPMNIAVRYERKDLVELLLKHRARLDLADSKGSRPIDVARQFNNKELEAFLTQAAAAPQDAPLSQ